VRVHCPGTERRFASAGLRGNRPALIQRLRHAVEGTNDCRIVAGAGEDERLSDFGIAVGWVIESLAYGGGDRIGVFQFRVCLDLIDPFGLHRIPSLVRRLGRLLKNVEMEIDKILHGLGRETMLLGEWRDLLDRPIVEFLYALGRFEGRGVEFRGLALRRLVTFGRLNLAGITGLVVRIVTEEVIYPRRLRVRRRRR
jgi:hypothetical protein